MDCVSDFFLLQLTGKKVVAVHVELQTERGPCGDTQIAERYCPVPETLGLSYTWTVQQIECATDIMFKQPGDLEPVNEIEIIVETFALVKLKECLSIGLVMPWFISLEPLYDEIIRTAIFTVKPDNIATFLGQRITYNCKKEVGAFCKNIQNLMEVFRVDPVREFLGGFHIRDFQESIIMHAVITVKRKSEPTITSVFSEQESNTIWVMYQSKCMISLAMSYG